MSAPVRTGDPMTPDADRRRAEALQSLFDALEAAPWAHDFFAVLRRVQALTPNSPRWGEAARPGQEPLRLGQEPELDFAPAALARLQREGRAVPRLGVRFFGLLGPQGPMPLHLTEYTRDRAHNHGDATLARFLDVFHHRMLALFYRAWAETQPVVQRDRPAEDRYAAWLGASIGLAPATAGRDSVPDAAKLYQAGLLGSRSRHPEGLAKLLAHYFGVPVQVHCHVPHRMHIEAEDRSHLGHARNRAERNRAAAARLGEHATLGNKVWDRQYKFRIALGPLTLAQYHAFLPGSSAWQRLRDWVHLYAGHDLLWDVQLGLHQVDVGALSLGRQLRLGMTSWLGTGGKRAGQRRSHHDRADLHLRPGSSTRTRRHGELHG